VGKDVEVDEQPLEALNTLLFLVTIVPATMYALTFVPLYFYPINAAKLQKIQEQLESVRHQKKNG